MSEDVMYAVVSGTYSDYRVLVLFPDEGQAEAHAQALRADRDSWQTDARVETFRVFGSAPRKVPVASVRLIITPDGKVRRWKTTKLSYEWEYDEWHTYGHRVATAPIHERSFGRHIFIDINEHPDRIEKVIQDLSHQATNEFAVWYERAINN